MRVPSGEGLRREAMEARRVFAEQSLKMLPRARRLAREFWGLIEALERRYADTVGEAWRLLQLALIEDVNCFLKALDARNADDLMDVVAECYDKLRPLSEQLRRALEWLEKGYVNELGRCHPVRGRVLLPVDALNELEKEVTGYIAMKRRAVELSLRAGVEPPKPCGELESSLLGAWDAYARLAKLQVGVIIRYPERAYLASLYLACAVEFLRYMHILAREIRRQEERVAGLEVCDYDLSCSALEAGELSVRREYLSSLRRILEGGGWRACRSATLAALGLVPMYLAHGFVPTLHFRLLDRVSGALIDSMHLAASYAYRRAIEALGRWGTGVEEEMCRARFALAHEMGEHARGPIRSVLRMREEYRRRLLEEGASTLERQLIERGIL